MAESVKVNSYTVTQSVVTAKAGKEKNSNDQKETEFAFFASLTADRKRMWKTIFLWTGMLSVGLSLAVVGTTLLDLQSQVSADLTAISSLLPARSAGYVLGSVFLPLVYSRVDFLMTSSVVFFTAGAMTLSFAFLKSLSSMITMFALNGVVMGLFDTGSYVFILQLWGQTAIPFMQVLMSMIGIGSLLAPVMAAPFLSDGGSGGDSGRNSSSSSGNGHLVNNTSLKDGDVSMSRTPAPVPWYQPSSLIYPFAIIAALLFFNALFAIVLWELDSNEDQEEEEEGGDNVSDDVFEPEVRHGVIRRQEQELQQHPQTRSHSPVSGGTKRSSLRSTKSRRKSRIGKSLTRDNLWKGVVTVLIALCIHLYWCIQVCFGSYLLPFVLSSDLMLSKSVGAEMTTVFWSAFTFFKLPVMMYFKGRRHGLVLMLSFATCLLSSLLMSFGQENGVVILWIGVPVLGAGVSSIWASAFGFMQSLFPVTEAMSSAMVITCMMSEFLLPSLIAAFITRFPLIIMWISASCSVGMIVLFSLTLFICNKKLKVK